MRIYRHVPIEQSQPTSMRLLWYSLASIRHTAGGLQFANQRLTEGKLLAIRQNGLDRGFVGRFRVDAQQRLGA